MKKFASGARAIRRIISLVNQRAAGFFDRRLIQLFLRWQDFKTTLRILWRRVVGLCDLCADPADAKMGTDGNPRQTFNRAHRRNRRQRLERSVIHYLAQSRRQMLDEPSHTPGMAQASRAGHTHRPHSSQRRSDAGEPSARFARLARAPVQASQPSEGQPPAI